MERMPCHGGAVADDDQLLARAGERYVDAADVGDEAELASVVGAHQRDDHRLLLAALEAVDGIDFQVGEVGEQLADPLHLRVVRRDDGDLLRGQEREQRLGRLRHYRSRDG